MVALRYMCVKAVDGASGVCVIRELPAKRCAIEELVARLPIQIERCGEGLPDLMQKVLYHLVCPDRQVPTAAMRAKFLQAQNNACNICGTVFEGGELEWDHIVPLHSTCTGNEQVFQALCKSCRSEKNTTV